MSISDPWELSNVWSAFPSRFVSDYILASYYLRNIATLSLLRWINIDAVAQFLIDLFCLLGSKSAFQPKVHPDCLWEGEETKHTIVFTCVLHSQKYMYGKTRVPMHLIVHNNLAYFLSSWLCGFRCIGKAEAVGTPHFATA